MAGAQLRITFTAPVTPAQLAWLRSTRRPVEFISFPDAVTGTPPRYDPACKLLATDPGILEHSVASLRVAENIIIPRQMPPANRPDPLRRFFTLTNVTLVMDGGMDEGRLTKLPPSVRHLTVVGTAELPDDNMISLQVDPPNLPQQPSQSMQSMLESPSLCPSLVCTSEPHGGQ